MHVFRRFWSVCRKMVAGTRVQCRGIIAVFLRKSTKIERKYSPNRSKVVQKAVWEAPGAILRKRDEEHAPQEDDYGYKAYRETRDCRRTGETESFLQGASPFERLFLPWSISSTQSSSGR